MLPIASDAAAARGEHHLRAARSHEERGRPQPEPAEPARDRVAAPRPHGAPLRSLCLGAHAQACGIARGGGAPKSSKKYPPKKFIQITVSPF